MQLLTTLDEHKASGPDRISPYILKHCTDEIMPILHVIFTQFLSTSLLPNDWLKAYVCPIHIKGSCSNVANYRPISLTSICAEVLIVLVFEPETYLPLSITKAKDMSSVSLIS